MPTFIKRKTKQIEHEDYIEVVRIQYTQAELRELYATEPSRFITVSESHAADVIRPQDNYQEVPDAITQQEAAHVSRHAPEGKPSVGKQRSASVSKGGRSNRGHGRQ